MYYFNGKIKYIVDRICSFRGVFVRKNQLLRPFLKWAGGKRQLVPEIKKYVPKKYNTYYEPFLGGGALLFELQCQRAVINDSNYELINCYNVVKDSLDDLIEDLRRHQDRTEENYYYAIRDLDRHGDKYEKMSTVQKASRIIYLNKTCYNGLFRVNSQGQFNVPYGKYKNPTVLDEAVLKAVSKYLKSNNIKILNGDFAEAVKDANKGDFVYFDPPYDPLSSTSSFTGYDVNGFNKDEQSRLKNIFEKLTNIGCKAILSNSCTDFIKDLYKDYRLEKVTATRSINANALKRGRVDEILVLNYDPEKERA